MEQILKVMTFNVRQMDGDDGEQSWPHRKEALCEVIRHYSPTLLGTQEIFAEQSNYILSNLPQYQCFGRGRFGDQRDKHNQVFYDAARMTLENSGEFWLSETPEVAGSMAWGIPRPRMITWGLLTIVQGPKVFVMNTHFPYGKNADDARLRSAELVRQKMRNIDPELLIVVTGDFNAAPDSLVHSQLTEELADSWCLATDRLGPASTVHGFGRFEGPRVDWILERGFNQVISAKTVTSKVNGLYPSDHYPVYAELAI
jgi:endonuclease/exonuclease/phosphatase family metal-dependent hydrolase